MTVHIVIKPDLQQVFISPDNVDAFNLIDPEILLVQEGLTELRSTVAIMNEQILASAANAQQEGDLRRVVPLDEELVRRIIVANSRKRVGIK